MRCCAVNAGQWNCKIEKVQLCQQTATFRCNGVPLCGTHVNSPPERVVVPFDQTITTTEAMT
jgi:hypothetical protein